MISLSDSCFLWFIPSWMLFTLQGSSWAECLWRWLSLDLHHEICIWPTELALPFLINSIVTEFHFSSLCHSSQPANGPPLQFTVMSWYESFKYQGAGTKMWFCGSHFYLEHTSVPMGYKRHRAQLHSYQKKPQLLSPSVSMRKGLLSLTQFGGAVKTHCTSLSKRLVGSLVAFLILWSDLALNVWPQTLGL